MSERGLTPLWHPLTANNTPPRRYHGARCILLRTVNTIRLHKGTLTS